MPVFLTQILFAMLVVYLCVSYFSARTYSPRLDIAGRWLRWLLFALIFGSLFCGRDADLASFAFWRLAAAGFLLWFLLETVYNWILIGALSRSQIPLFPRFRANLAGDEWPLERRTAHLRQWLKARGFRRLQSVKSELESTVVLRSGIYQSEDDAIRLQVLFIPKRPGVVQINYVLSTCTQEGERVITDNIYVPYGGYYPDNWFLERRPLQQSLEKLLSLHKRRLLRGGVNVQPWQEEDEPLEDLNRQQSELERFNVEAGFLVDLREQETYGRLTSEGRYRLWKEIWLLKYFGINLS